jgi:D-alanyl-D-alanine carboxypeptidase (penicillin-binding protein 5/6)
VILPTFSRKQYILFGGFFAVFLASFSLHFVKKPAVYIAKTTEYSVSDLPLIKDKNSFPLLTAQGVYAYDIDSGVVFYEKSADQILFPASTTKIVTALVALDAYEADEVLNAGTVKVNGSRMGLSWFENMTAHDLLYGLLVLSANDAAEVLASNYEGGREAFIKAMNLKARELHAYNTNFENPSGLDQTGQMTTAKDLARIASQAMLVPEFAEIVGTKEYLAKNVEGNIIHPLANRNELLGEVEGVLGVKTGWTEQARENLVTYVDRDGRRIIVSLLGSQDRFSESKTLVEWIYDNFEWKDVSTDRYFLH